MEPRTRITYQGKNYVLVDDAVPTPELHTAAVTVVDEPGDPRLASSPRDDEREDTAPGRLVQYYTNGPGYTPTTSTVASIPAGVYQIKLVNMAPTLVPHSMVTDQLLRLPDSKSDMVIAEIDKFWTLKQKFAEHGYVNKRGFLLWGPPGSGKTATVSTVAKQMVDTGGIVILATTSPSRVAAMLTDIRQVEVSRRIVCVVEDIDAVVANYGETDTLALLDGEYSVNDIVFIATTNYPEKLDRRMIDRPSRFDKVVKIGMPNAASRQMYLESRHLQLAPTEMAQWVKATEGMSIAHLKELIVATQCFGNKFASTIKRLRKMTATPPSSEQYLRGKSLRNRAVDPDSPVLHKAEVQTADAHDLHSTVGRRGYAE